MRGEAFVPTNGTSTVKALRETPLALLKLRVTVGDVVGGRVAEHVAQCTFLCHVLASPADDDGQLGLVVAAVVV